MHRKQLDKWIHGFHQSSYQPPKVFVISCSDLSCYLLAVEYKHKVEPVLVDNEPIHEFGATDGPMYHDIAMSLTTH